MADEAAGAVRRTQGLIDTAVKAIVANPNLVAAVVKACKCCTSDHYEPSGGAPYPAECRWCDHEPNRHGEAELAKLRVPVMDSLGDLLASPDQRRPVVLLRAEDCACTPPYADCPHGPEPVDALDLAVWLHAESEWWLGQYKHDVVLWRQQVTATEGERDAARAEVEELSRENRRLHRQVGRLPYRQRDYERARLELRKLNDAMARKNRIIDKRVAERDALQARIDAALAKLDKVREDARELIELREKGAPIDLAPMSAVDDLEKTIRAALQATEESGR